MEKKILKENPMTDTSVTLSLTLNQFSMATKDMFSAVMRYRLVSGIGRFSNTKYRYRK